MQITGEIKIKFIVVISRDAGEHRDSGFDSPPPRDRMICFGLFQIKFHPPLNMFGLVLKS